MDHVLEDSAAARCMCALPARDWCQAERGVSAVFACDRPASDFRARLSRKFRANLRSAERRLALAGEVQFQTYADPAGLRRAYPEFLVLEAAGWKGAGGERGAIRLKPAELAFYDELVSMASRLPAGASVAAPACEIHALYLSGACVASALCLRGGGEMAVPKIAYSEAHARLAPGHLLLQHLIGRCMQDTTLQRLNMVSHAAWLAPWQPQAVGQRRVVIGLGRWDGPLRVALLAAGERGWSRWRQGYAGLARWPAAQADRPPAPKRAERMAITTCATFEAYSALLAALPPKDPDGHLGLSAAWAASVMPLWRWRLTVRARRARACWR
jgi:hypothetical protein